MRYNHITILLLTGACACVPSWAKNNVNVDSLIQSAELSVSNGNYKTAVDFYGKALKKRKNDFSLIQRKANAELLNSEPKKAVSDLKKSIALAPNDSTNYQLRARAFESLRDYKREKSDLDRLLSLTPPLGTNYLWRAHINEVLKNQKEVISDCTQALQLGLERKDLADLYKLRSEAFKKMGKKKEAQQEIAKYESLSP